MIKYWNDKEAIISPGLGPSTYFTGNYCGYHGGVFISKPMEPDELFCKTGDSY